jgi:hypothetical protein
MRSSIALWIVLASLLGRSAPALAKQGVGIGRPARLLHHAVLRTSPSATHPVVARAEKGSRVTVVRVKNGWCRVNGQGISGWLPAGLLAEPDARVARRQGGIPTIEAREDEASPDERHFERAPVPPSASAPLRVTLPSVAAHPAEALPLVSAQAPLATSDGHDAATEGAASWMDLQVGAGVESVQHRVVSTSRLPLGSYEASAISATLGFSGRARLRLGRGWELAGDAGYQIASAKPGLRVVIDDRTEELDLLREALDFGAQVGWRARSAGLAVLTRAGYHLESTDLRRGISVQLPSDRVRGPTAGLVLEALRVRRVVDVRLGLDVLIRGNRDQTQGLREGTRSPTFGVYAAASTRFRIGASAGIDLSYRLAHTQTRFQGESERLPDGAGATRSTMAHAMLVGASYQLD